MPESKLRHDPMEKMPRQTKTTSSNFLLSSLQSGLKIAAYITSLVALGTSIWLIGTFIGKPWGSLFYHLVKWSDPEISPTPEVEEFTGTIGGFAALIFCGVTILVKAVGAEGREEEGGERKGAVWVLGEGCLAGLVALAVTGILIGAVGLGRLS